METTSDEQSHTRGIGLNWLWFGPSIVFVLTATEWHTVSFAWTVATLIFNRWHWAGLFSPSGAFCYTVTIASVIFPVRGVLLASRLLADRNQPWKRIFPVVTLLVLILALPLITDTLIWGSFPFTYDSAGYGHIRLIPFIPWPSGGYMAFQ
jgi:hypothetical protein